MARTEGTADGEQLVRDLDVEDAAELLAGDDEMNWSMAAREGRSGLVLRLNHQRKHAWYAPDIDAPNSQWHEADYPAVYDRLDPRMQAFVCNGEVSAGSDDGIVVDTAFSAV